MARPRFHTLATAPLAWALYHRWGGPAALGAVATGTLVDLDHLVDYAWTRLRGARSHYFAPLHGWELALAISVLALVAGRTAAADMGLPDKLARRRGLAGALGRAGGGGLLAGLGAGLWLHLVQDLLTNRPAHAGVYALTYRLRHGFKREATGWGNHSDFHWWSDKPWYRWF
jgi:hypothetical protein